MIDRYKYAKIGIGFWIGGGVYSFINLMMNLNQVSRDKVLNYDYIITAAAIFGLIFNIFLLKKSKKEV